MHKPKGQKKEQPVADEETVKKLITAFEGQSMKYETYFKLVLATGLRRGEKEIRQRVANGMFVKSIELM